jgi:hypothetical protein
MMYPDPAQLHELALLAQQVAHWLRQFTHLQREHPDPVDAAGPAAMLHMPIGKALARLDDHPLKRPPALGEGEPPTVTALREAYQAVRQHVKLERQSGAPDGDGALSAAPWSSPLVSTERLDWLERAAAEMATCAEALETAGVPVLTDTSLSSKALRHLVCDAGRKGGRPESRAASTLDCSANQP